MAIVRRAGADEVRRHDDECRPDSPCAACEKPWADQATLRRWYVGTHLTQQATRPTA